VKRIHNIEWTPGAACPPTYSPQYIPEYRKILENGKRLLLLAEAKEIEPLLSHLPPEGLFLFTQVDSEDDANALLKKVADWSARKDRVGLGACSDGVVTA
jgi:hypothetical protein